jgi:hypothetical protein
MSHIHTTDRTNTFERGQRISAVTTDVYRL